MYLTIPADNPIIFRLNNCFQKDTEYIDIDTENKAWFSTSQGVLGLTCPGHSVAGLLGTGSEGHPDQSPHRSPPRCPSGWLRTQEVKYPRPDGGKVETSIQLNRVLQVSLSQEKKCDFPVLNTQNMNKKYIPGTLRAAVLLYWCQGQWRVPADQYL